MITLGGVAITIAPGAEGRVSVKKDNKELTDVFETCLMCAACTCACYGKVVTHKHTAQMKRSLNIKPSAALKEILNFLSKTKKKSYLSLKIFNFLRITGALALLAKTKALKLLRHSHLYDIHLQIDKPVFKFAGENFNTNLKDIKCLYFMSCSADFIYPKVAKATMRVIEKFIGTVKPLGNPCCAALHFAHNNLSRAKQNAKKIILLYEEQSKGKNIPLVTDCSSCAYQLKNFDEIFNGDENWHKRALNFSRNVKDLSEIVEKNALRNNPDCEKITAHQSACAYYKQNLSTIELLKLISDNNFTQSAQDSVPCGGELGFNFTRPDFADVLLKRKIANIADTQSSTVVTTDGFSLCFIARGLKRYYPIAKVKHLSLLLEENIVK